MTTTHLPDPPAWPGPYLRLEPLDWKRLPSHSRLSPTVTIFPREDGPPAVDASSEISNHSIRIELAPKSAWKVGEDIGHLNGDGEQTPRNGVAETQVPSGSVAGSNIESSTGGLQVKVEAAAGSPDSDVRAFNAEWRGDPSLVAETSSTQLNAIIAKQIAEAITAKGYIIDDQIIMKAYQQLRTPVDIGDRNGHRRAPELRTFVRQLLAEAYDIATNRVPKFSKVKDRKEKGVDSSIKTSSTMLKGWDIKVANTKQNSNQIRDWDAFKADMEETWFARESEHEDAAKDGTASWEEFVKGLRDSHSENEMDYTEDIYDARLLLDYSEELRNAGLTQEFQGLTLRIFEMAHHIPLFNNRVFATLVLTGSISEDAFLVAQFPVELKGSAIAFYSENRHKKKDVELSDSEMKSSVVIGAYTSVEYCQRANEKVQWLMTTSSDAKGAIPLKLQQMQLPAVIAKDVRFFIDWSKKRRQGA